MSITVTLTNAAPIDVAVDEDAASVTLGTGSTIDVTIENAGGGGTGETEHRLVLDFAYGDATPEVIGTVPANSTVLSVLISIETAFDGSGAALSVGTLASPSSLMSASQNAPSTVAQYEVFPGVSYGTDTALYLTITPGGGATAGHGQVVVDYE